MKPLPADLVFAYVPVPDAQTGRKLASAALSEKLAACANLLGPMTSFFEWEGASRSEEEWLLILKTTVTQQPSLMACLEAAHPYTCPCISFFPVTVNPAFADWVRGETAS